MSFILDDGMGKPQPQQGAGGDAVKETTAATFMADVIEQSQTVPVIVDFWAPWCGPCKTLGPTLEKLVRQSGGRVKMVKINVDEEQQLAAQFRIQSIPTVYAFKDGRPADGFQGALPESQLKQFIDRLVGGGANVIDDAIAQAKEALDAGQAEQAAAIYEEVLGEDPANPVALAGIMRCYMAMGEADAAREVLGQLPADILAHPEVQGVKTALELASEAGKYADEIAELEARVQAAPADLDARFELANALYAANKRTEAVDQLLEIFKRDRTWNEEMARKQLVKFFEAFGPTDPATIHGRKKLSLLMFA
ncbi:thioredoxin [Caenispirillum bisanense]|uniref:Thioredoxin n=1 Tax=Caenispirillum bisanense TaxID=414052 RepID=A0A286GUB9_9PROT|nr:thioredoxin [Caenispirillum bisanense]SOD99108.1 thioredoxin [Caenispirillum bisanense]